MCIMNFIQVHDFEGFHCKRCVCYYTNFMLHGSLHLQITHTLGMDTHGLATHVYEVNEEYHTSNDVKVINDIIEFK